MITLDQYLYFRARTILFCGDGINSLFFKGMYEANRVIIYQNYFCHRKFYSLAYLRGL